MVMINIELQHIDSIELQELINYLTVILNRQLLEITRINDSKKGKKDKKVDIL